MSIVWANNGTASSGSTGTITPAYPLTPASGDLFLNFVLCKYATRTINTVSTWTALGTTTGGAGTDGTTDEGNVKVAVFSKISDGTETGTISQTFTGGTTNMAGARISRFTRSAGTGWLIDGSAIASINSGGTTAISAAFDVDPGFQAGDMAVVFGAFNADTYNFSSHGLSAAGATFAAATPAEAMDGGFTDGSDARILVALFDCTAGASSGVATFTSTASGSAANAPAGALVLVRLREDGLSGGIAKISSGYAIRGVMR